MAHTSAKTPTKAAELIITHNKVFEDRLLSFQQSIVINSQSFLAKQNSVFNKINSEIVNNSRTALESGKNNLRILKQQFTTSSSRIITDVKLELNSKRFAISNLPAMLINREIKEVSRFLPKLISALTNKVSTERRSLKNVVALINVISPENILRKGFAIVKSKGEITSDPDQFSPGSEIEIILRSQNIKATVNTKKDYHGKDFNLPTGI